MRVPSIDDGFSPAARPTPEQRLAAAVLRRAVNDARNPKLPEGERRGATAFLLGTAAFDFWASVAGISPGAVQDRARRLLAVAKQ
jgi:hypothetical protein